MAQMLQPAPGNGVKRAPGEPLEIEVKRRVENVVLVRGYHPLNLTELRGGVFKIAPRFAAEWGAYCEFFKRDHCIRPIQF
jgi:hypothetical protein